MVTLVFNERQARQSQTSMFTHLFKYQLLTSKRKIQSARGVISTLSQSNWRCDGYKTTTEAQMILSLAPLNHVCEIGQVIHANSILLGKVLLHKVLLWNSNYFRICGIRLRYSLFQTEAWDKYFIKRVQISKSKITQKRGS